MLPADGEVRNVPLLAAIELEEPYLSLVYPRSLCRVGQLAGVDIFLDRGHSAIETSDSHRPIPTSETVGADPLREGQADAKKFHPPPWSSPELVPCPVTYLET